MSDVFNEDEQAPIAGERLQKVLARAGFGSRRACDDLIADEKVTVNGEIAVLGRRVNADVDVVEVNGARIGILPGMVYYLLNKPAGVVTTADDPQGRPEIVSLVPDEPRVFPVGRLDMDTEGLIILTNDGDLAQLLSHPSRGIEKEYLAELDIDPSPRAIRQLREGVEIEPGVKTAPAQVARITAKVVRITIHEGKNRQVRKMCAAIGGEVLRLVRVRLGTITDTTLAPGEWRLLTTIEVRNLERIAIPTGSRASRRAATSN